MEAALPKERSAVLRNLFNLDHQHIRRPCVDPDRRTRARRGRSTGEIVYAAGFSSVRRGSQAHLRRHRSPNLQVAASSWKRPVGVFAAITPWISRRDVTRKAGPGWPSVHGRYQAGLHRLLSLHALGVLAERAGLPKGVCNVGPARPGDRRGTDAEHDRSQGCHSPGSTEVGARLLEQCAPTSRRRAWSSAARAVIVFDDADIDAAVGWLPWPKYRNCGQPALPPTVTGAVRHLREILAGGIAQETLGQVGKRR